MQAGSNRVRDAGHERQSAVGTSSQRPPADSWSVTSSNRLQTTMLTRFACLGGTFCCCCCAARGSQEAALAGCLADGRLRESLPSAPRSCRAFVGRSADCGPSSDDWSNGAACTVLDDRPRLRGQLGLPAFVPRRPLPIPAAAAAAEEVRGAAA